MKTLEYRRERQDQVPAAIQTARRFHRHRVGRFGRQATPFDAERADRHRRRLSLLTAPWRARHRLVTAQTQRSGRSQHSGAPNRSSLALWPEGFESSAGWLSCDSQTPRFKPLLKNSERRQGSQTSTSKTPSSGKFPPRCFNSENQGSLHAWMELDDTSFNVLDFSLHGRLEVKWGLG